MLDTPSGSCQHHHPVASPVILSPPSIAARYSLAAHSLRPRLLCFGRTMLVGFWANVLDFEDGLAIEETVHGAAESAAKGAWVTIGNGR